MVDETDQNKTSSPTIALRLFLFIFFIGLAFSLAIALWQHKQNDLHSKQRLNAFTSQINTSLKEKVTLYQYGLRGLRGHIATSYPDRLSRKNFLIYSYTRDYKKEFPGALGFGFIRRIPQHDSDAFITEAQQDDWPNFAIRELSPNTGERYVIQYIFPREDNSLAIGLDIASEKNRKTAAKNAISSGDPQLSGPITLVQASGLPKQSFLFLMPVFKTGYTPDTVQLRLQEGFGWTYAPIISEELLNEFHIDDKLMSVVITDITPNSVPTVFYDSAQSSTIKSVLSSTQNLTVYGRQWKIDVNANANFIEHLKQPSTIVIFLVGMLISTLVSAITYVVTVNRFRKKQARDNAELLLLNGQLHIASNLAGLGIWSWHIRDNTLQWNDRMFEIYELPLTLKNNGLDYNHWLMCLHPEDKKLTDSALQGLVEGTSDYDLTFRIILPDQSVRYIRASAQVEKDAKGKPINVTGMNLDITQQHNYQAYMQAAKEQADAASQAKSSFVANMSHEIRTPMNAVLGMLQLIQKTSLTLTQQDYIAKASSAAKSLLQLLNDILDFSKIDAGKLSLDVHPFELDNLLSDVATIIG
ncbi:hypothetical protein LCGC14_0808910, partial [marine sediment metagenome]|nr:hypothetical protein [Methylophaga sp.]